MINYMCKSPDTSCGQDCTISSSKDLCKPEDVKFLICPAGFDAEWEVIPEIPELIRLRQRLERIAKIIYAVDERCLAADGPVTKTLQEMTVKEMIEIYKIASEKPEVIIGGRIDETDTFLLNSIMENIMVICSEGTEFMTRTEISDAVCREARRAHYICKSMVDNPR